MEIEKTQWVVKDPKDGRKFLTIRIFKASGYWSFEYSDIKNDTLKTYGLKFKEDNSRVVEMWLERNNIHHMKMEVREMIKQIMGEKTSARSVLSSFKG